MSQSGPTGTGTRTPELLVCSVPDGVPAEPVHLPRRYVHRQLGTVGERRTDSLLPRVRLPEYHPYTTNNTGQLVYVHGLFDFPPPHHVLL